MSLRVIGGEYRGRRLRSLPGRSTRPLLGQVREALFNILGPGGAEGAHVWDLFAGTGASGIEALSRGAAHVYFLEKGRDALGILGSNLETLGPDAQERSKVLRADAWDPPSLSDPADPTPGGAERAPDLVFFDPPYAAVERDPQAAAARADALVRRLAPGGQMYFHFPKGVLAATDFDPAHAVDLRVWGSAAVARLGRGD